MSNFPGVDESFARLHRAGERCTYLMGGPERRGRWKV